MHSFYIGTESELREPWGTTDIGIPTWTSGVRELEWTVPDENSDLRFACTVPGHFESMHGTFTVTNRRLAPRLRTPPIGQGDGR